MRNAIPLIALSLIIIRTPCAQASEIGSLTYNKVTIPVRVWQSQPSLKLIRKTFPQSTHEIQDLPCSQGTCFFAKERDRAERGWYISPAFGSHQLWMGIPTDGLQNLIDNAKEAFSMNFTFGKASIHVSERPCSTSQERCFRDAKSALVRAGYTSRQSESNCCSETLYSQHSVAQIQAEEGRIQTILSRGQHANESDTTIETKDQ